jgi:hypothetical protein
MPYYNYRFLRVADDQKFTGEYLTDQHSLLEFGKLVNDNLTFEGEGISPYMWGRREDPLGFFKVDRHVYSGKRSGLSS